MNKDGNVGVGREQIANQWTGIVHLYQIKHTHTHTHTHSLSLSLSHTHTHTYIYIYIYMSGMDPCCLGLEIIY